MEGLLCYVFKRHMTIKQLEKKLLSSGKAFAEAWQCLGESANITLRFTIRV